MYIIYIANEYIFNVLWGSQSRLSPVVRRVKNMDGCVGCVVWVTSYEMMTWRKKKENYDYFFSY